MLPGKKNAHVNPQTTGRGPMDPDTSFNQCSRSYYRNLKTDVPPNPPQHRTYLVHTLIFSAWIHLLTQSHHFAVKNVWGPMDPDVFYELLCEIGMRYELLFPINLKSLVPRHD